MSVGWQRAPSILVERKQHTVDPHLITIFAPREKETALHGAIVMAQFDGPAIDKVAAGQVVVADAGTR